MARKYSPNNPVIFLRLGELSMRLQNWKSAGGRIVKGLKFVGDNTNIKVLLLLSLSITTKAMGKDDQANQLYDDAVSLDPEVRNNLGTLPSIAEMQQYLLEQLGNLILLPAAFEDSPE